MLMLSKGLLTTQIVCLSLLVIATLSHKFLSLPFKASFGLFGLSLLVSVVVALMALVCFLATLATVPKSAFALPLVLAICPLVLIVGLVGPGAFKAPRIHDISTNLDVPILFRHAQALRSPGENSLAAPASAVTDQQKAFYQDLEAIKSPLDAKAAYVKALATARALNWHVHHEDEAQLQFEAVEETAFFGFKDDVVVRISPVSDDSRVLIQGQKPNHLSRIDLRSVSRVGVSDLGANAQRIKRFVQRFGL